MLYNGILKVLLQTKHSDGDPTPRSLRPVTGTVLSLSGNMIDKASFGLHAYALTFVML